MTKKETIKKVRAIRDNFPLFAKEFLKIKTKDAKIVPFEFNQSQQYFHSVCEEELRKTGRVRIIVVKGRQSGISTYVGGRFYHKTSMKFALNTFILSHESGTTDKLFKIVKLYNDKNPIAPPVKQSNAKELSFEGLNSQYYVGTAGSGEVGRGGTVQLFHGSEVAMWKNTDDIETGLMESIPDMAGTEVILESTAKGLGNMFYRFAMDALKGANGYRLVFIPWFWMDEYEEDVDDRFCFSDDEEIYCETYLSEYSEERQKRKIMWRRMKIIRFGKAWKFKQEYPSNVSEAFQTTSDTLINGESVVKAKDRISIAGNTAPLVIGVDPARNNDRAIMAFRRGREIERIIKHENTGDDIWYANKIIEMINKYSPAAVNIDCTNSYAIYDYIRDKGYGNVTNAIHFSKAATDDRLYANKRAEMWCLLADWFDLDDVVVPDDDEMHVDLLSVPDYDETDGKIRLMSKKKIKEVLGCSPDIGDAFALTFAVKLGAATAGSIKSKNSGIKTINKFKGRGKR